MNNSLPHITIVIPTHNRCSSLKRLLDKLAVQTYPLDQMEVIVAADGCSDGTLHMLKAYKALFALRYIEVPGLGPAVARNRGANIANGKLLLFLDDDIEPSNGLIKAHVRAHVNENVVVIGYLPFHIEGQGFFLKNLRLWWEQKYFTMRHPGYRYSYQDFLTGNVSLSLDLFNRVGGFDETLRCREDYELGIRLMKARAEFFFCKEAWGYHCDGATNLHRSLERKREEGRADVQCWRLHPDVTNHLQEAFVNHKYVLMKPGLVSFIGRNPWLTDNAARAVEYCASIAERFRLRKHWRFLVSKLHNYWYVRGLFDELQTHKRFKEYLRHDPSKHLQEEEVELDLINGITYAEQLLDRLQPAGIIIRYHKEVLYRLGYKVHYERLRGRHLRYILAMHIPVAFIKVLAFQELPGKCIEEEEVSTLLNLY